MDRRWFLARVTGIEKRTDEFTRRVTTLVQVEPLPGQWRAVVPTPTWGGPFPPRLGQLVRAVFTSTFFAWTWKAAPITARTFATPA